MTVRRTLPYLLAALLGVGAAVLAACGSGSDSGIPAANAGDLKSQINDVRQAVDDGRCSDVPGQLRQVDEGIDDLPPSTDDQLVNNLRDGANKLLDLAREECDATPAETTTTETTTTETTTTETAPVETTPQPTETTTTETPTTTTAPPTTTQPAPPPPEPAPVPEPVPPPPAGTPGGGVEPEIP
jgi:outer membrane biosynthesis protein TonB